MTITYHIFNSINSKNLLRVEMPWDYTKAVKGFYSNFWRRVKTGCASNAKLDKMFVKAKIVIGTSNTDRFEMTFPSGMKFNSPFDLNETDFKIIDLHLQALSLSVGDFKEIF